MYITPSMEYGRINHPDVEHIDWFSAAQFDRAMGLHILMRYSAIEQMTHRTTVLQHSLRVSSLVLLYGIMLGSQGIPFDLPRAAFMADHHDDPEIITDDIPTPVKRKATPDQRAKFKAEERAAAKELEHIIPKPRSINSFYPEIYEELEKKETLEARVVNYADKKDGLHEAVHEVVCGDYPDLFVPVIDAYQPDFEKLNAQNADWQGIVANVFGTGLFDFPLPTKLKPKQVDRLDFSDSDAFISSVSDENPVSYDFWLRSCKNVFRLSFLDDVFPGWKNALPEKVRNDIQSLSNGSEMTQLNSGLYVPVGRFAMSLLEDDFDFRLSALASSRNPRRDDS